jgi:AcrR family transcriptional regulator
MPAPSGESRRERLRRELTDQIVEIGRRQLESGGIAAVSWRAIAREVGMNPASLYTYIDGIDDLYTRILLQSFDRLAVVVRAAYEETAAGPPAARAAACARAFRSWALAHPRQYNLIYTDQIPGYAAPPGGPTIEAEMAVERPFLEAVADLLDRDDPMSLLDGDSELSRSLYALRAMLHGFTSLEVNHHSPYLDGSDEMMVAALNRSLDDLVDRFGPHIPD